MTVRGSIAYNPKDLEPWGFIDPVVTNTAPEDEPKGTAIISWPVGTFISNWGQEFPAARIHFTSVDEDLLPGETSVTYIAILTFVYYDYEGVEVESRTRTIRFIVQNAGETPHDDLPQDSLNSYYLFPDSEFRKDVEVDVVGTLQLNPGSELIGRIVGLQYDDYLVFGKGNIRLLPSDRLGLYLNWSDSAPAPSAGSSGGGFGSIGGGGFGSIGGAPIFGAGVTSKNTKWVFQLANAKTIVDRKIVITQTMIDAPRILGKIPIQIVGDEEGITRVLCAVDEPLDLDASELETLGTSFTTPEAVEGNRTGYDRYDDGALWDKTLKQAYRSDFVERGETGINYGRKHQSAIHNSEYDLVANTILIDPSIDGGGEIEAGHEIYITYGHVYDFMLRQIVEIKQGFTSMFVAGVPFGYGVSSSFVDVHSYLPQTFWASVEQTDKYIYDDINMDNQEDVEFTGIIVVDPDRTFFPEATWEKYIEDQENLKEAAENDIPSAQVSTNLVKVFCQRQINSMRGSYMYSLVTDFPLFPNGVIIGAYSYNGGIPGGILWVNLLNWNEVRLLIPRDQIRDQEWFYEWFVDNIGAIRVNLSGGEPKDLDISSFVDWNRDTWDIYFDQNIFVNSFVDDNNKVAYEAYTAEAINNCSEYNPADDTGTTGIGFANLDFFEPGTLDPRINGLPGIDSKYYSDASSSFFITPPRQSKDPRVWDPVVIDAIPGVYGSTSSLIQEATYFYFQPLQLNQYGRVYFEKLPVGSGTDVRVVTRPSVSSANNTTTNYGRTRGLYSTPDQDGVHSRIYSADTSIINEMYSMNRIQSGFSHTSMEQGVMYGLYSYRENLGVELYYTNGLRIVNAPLPERRTIDLKKEFITGGFGGFELILPGYTERIILYYKIDPKELDGAILTLSIIGDSSNTEYIDIRGMQSEGYIDVYVGYFTGTIYVSSNMSSGAIQELSASIYWIDEGEMERISATCMSSSPSIDSVGNHNIFELISGTSKTNMSVLRAGQGAGPYFSFPYLFLTFDSEEITSMVVRTDYKKTTAHVFFTIDGSLLVKKFIFSDFDASQAANISLSFLSDGIDGAAFVTAGYSGQEGMLVSYRYLLETFNQCHQAASLYFEPSYLIQSNISDNLWLGNELLSSAVYVAHLGSELTFPEYDFDNLDLDEDKYMSRVIASDGVIKAYLSEDNQYFEDLGYTIPVDNGFTVEFLSNGSIIVLFLYEGRIYGRIKSEDKEWVPLFKIDGKVSGYSPIRFSKLSPQDIGLDGGDMNEEVDISDLDEDMLDIDLSYENISVNSISSCYDPSSDNLYIFYSLDGFLAFHTIKGSSIARDLGHDTFYMLDSSTPRSILSFNESSFPVFLTGEIGDELADSIIIKGNNYLQFKYPIESVGDFKTDNMFVQGSPVSSFVLSSGMVRFMYIDSNESLRGGVISGGTPQLDVQLRKSN